MKDARQKYIIFGSWTGAAVEAAATATISGEGITAAEVTAATFGTKVGGVSGSYTFTYDGTSTTWKYQGTAATLSQYGITATGTPEDGDAITIVYTAANGGWEALGKDVDNLSKELNADTENTKNVLGETRFEHKGYQSTIGMDTYYMDPGRLMYAHLLDVALTEKYDEGSLLGYMAEAYFTSVNEEAQTMSGYCYVRRAWIVPQSVGGDTAGFAIPFTVNPQGGMEKKAITYDMVTNTATVTDLSNS